MTDWTFFVEVTLAGLAAGTLYAVTALGFVVVYKATRVINFAVGELLMVSAYLFLGFTSGLALPAWLAIPLTLAGAGLVGAVVERAAIRPMLSEPPISVVMVTIGVSSILIGLVEIVWTTAPRRLPEFLPIEPLVLGEVFVAPKAAYGGLAAAAATVLFLLGFRFSRGAVALRATAADRAAACTMGIDIRRVSSIAWVVGALASGVAGICVGSISGLSPAMGEFGLSVLVVAILGGLDSVPGALVGGLLVGWLEGVTGAYAGGEYTRLATVTLLVPILLVRPYGLFGTREIERL